MPIALGLDQSSEICSGEEDPVPVRALSHRRLAEGPLHHLGITSRTRHALHGTTILLMEDLLLESES